MALEVPPPVLDRLADIEGEMKPVVDYEVASSLGGAHRAEGLTDAQRKGAWAEASAFNFMPRNGKGPSVWGTHFGPVRSATNDDGTPFYAPDIKEIDAEIVEHWERRSEEAKHPVFRARYADLVWDLKEGVTGARPDVRFARTAIDSYVEAVESGVHKQPIHGIHYAERALALAMSVNDQGRIRAVKETMFRLFDKVASPREAGTWPFLFDNLYGNKRVSLSNEEEQKIIESLESILEQSCQQGESFNPWGAQAAAERLAKHYERLGRKQDVHQVIRKYGGAFESLAEGASPTLAMAWLQPVLEGYRDRGMAEDTARVQLASSEKGKKVASDLREITIPFEISQENLVAFLGAMTTGSVDQTLLRIAIRFIPKAGEVRAFLQDIARKHPFMALTPVIRIADGHIAARAGSIEQDPDGRLLLQLAENIDIGSIFLSLSIERARARHGLDADTVTNFLFRSSVYDPDRRTLIHEGAEAYLRGDHTKAVHVLIPQIEHALRRLLGLMRVPTNKPNRHGTMQVKNLNDILREESIKTCLGEDLHLYLLTFLADPRGHNVRNRVSHGLVPVEQITAQLSDRVIHILFALALIQKKEDAPQD